MGFNSGFKGLIRSKVLHTTFNREGCCLRNSKVSAKHSHSLHLRLALPAVTSLTQFMNSQISTILTHHSRHIGNCINLLLQTPLSLTSNTGTWGVSFASIFNAQIFILCKIYTTCQKIVKEF